MAANLATVSTPRKPAAQNVAALRQVFGSIKAESCPHVYNFHMHTNHSDGQLQPELLMKQAIALSLKGFAITDHHRVSGYQVAQQWFDDWQNSPESAGKTIPQFWVGAEITSQLLETEVHILGFAFDPEHGAIVPYLQGEAPQGEAAQAAQVISAIHQAGGLAVLAHPVRYRRSPDDLIPAAVNCGMDGVETYYAYNNPKPWRASPSETQRVRQLSDHHHLLNTCGTDTHGLSLLQRI
ncbi:MAG: PHP domain-containing protein [Phormidesmis sp. CAN_BIN36]|nr:PHP domain-containing protein [Phormidesmis sp. CAN_BIN36]